MSEAVFTKIDSVFLPVRDLDRALDWYAALLGWEVAWRTEAVATLQAGATPLTLVQHVYPGQREAPAGFQFQPLATVAFSLFAPDIERAHARLETAGVAVGPIEVHGDEREFSFTDPDGNVIGVCWWPD